MPQKFDDLIKAFIKKNGKRKLEKILLESLTENAPNVLTIIISEDTHKIPKDIIHGEKFVMSKGDLNNFDQDILKQQIEERLLKLVKKLKDKEWNKIYFIPSGFPELSIMAKLLIYRVTRIDSIDIVYTGNGKYTEMHFNSRAISGSSEKTLY